MLESLDSGGLAVFVSYIIVIYILYMRLYRKYVINKYLQYKEKVDCMHHTYIYIYIHVYVYVHVNLYISCSSFTSIHTSLITWALPACLPVKSRHVIHESRGLGIRAGRGVPKDGLDLGSEGPIKDP